MRILRFVSTISFLWNPATKLLNKLLDQLFFIPVKCARNRAAYFAEVLYVSMKGLGTSDGRLIRTIVTRSEVDLFDIKHEFNRMYKQTVEKWIEVCLRTYYLLSFSSFLMHPWPQLELLHHNNQFSMTNPLQLRHGYFSGRHFWEISCWPVGASEGEYSMKQRILLVYFVREFRVNRDSIYICHVSMSSRTITAGFRWHFASRVSNNTRP